MTPRNQLIEQLTQAEHSLSFAVGHLRDANKLARAVESLLILDAIRDAAEVANRVKAILSAVTETRPPLEQYKDSEAAFRNRRNIDTF